MLLKIKIVIRNKSIITKLIVEIIIDWTNILILPNKKLLIFQLKINKYWVNLLIRLSNVDKKYNPIDIKIFKAILFTIISSFGIKLIRNFIEYYCCLLCFICSYFYIYREY